MSTEIETITQEILASKKYACLCEPLIQRICEEEYPKYKKDKERIKAVKNRLHLMYGAFFGDVCHQKANTLLDTFCESGHGDPLETSMEIMQLHSSTNERLHTMAMLYAWIAETTGQAASILDIGCGFNPFSLPWMSASGLFHSPFTLPEVYHAYDIDRRTAGLINRYFGLLGMRQTAACMDIASQIPDEPADIAFLFKFIPVMEAQRKGRGLQLIHEINAKSIVVTYPLQSLCGKEKGMKAHYTASFEEMLDGRFQVAGRAVVGNELVYAVVK